MGQNERRPLWGFIGTDGNYVIEPQYDDAWPFSEGLARVKTGFMRGFIDRSGAYVIEPVYDAAGDFREGLAPVGLDGLHGYIRPDGSVAIPLQFSRAGEFDDGLALVARGDLQTYITPDGNPVGGVWYEFAGRFSGGIAMVCADGKYGTIDRSGAYVTEPVYDSPAALREAGLMPPDPEPQLPPVESEGLTMVTEGGKIGFTDMDGSMVIAPRYAAAGLFCDGLARVRTSARGKWGYIGHDGKYAFKQRFDEAEDFAEGLARVMTVVTE